jgi:hypothetical protein
MQWMDESTKLADLRTIVAKVEQKAHVPADNPDVIALKNIVEHRIEELQDNRNLPKPPSDTNRARR